MMIETNDRREKNWESIAGIARKTNSVEPSIELFLSLDCRNASMKLPNGQKAQLGDKLEQYCLNFQHSRGKDKATLFLRRLGITLENKEILETALLEAAIVEDATLYKEDQYGIHYDIKFLLQTEVGSSLVLSCWITRTGEEFLRSLTLIQSIDEAITMSIHEYDLVATTEDIPAIHKDTNQPILLRRGQIGTVLMIFENEACLVDFANAQGMTYAMETIPMSQLLLLLQEPEVLSA